MKPLPDTCDDHDPQDGVGGTRLEFAVEPGARPANGKQEADVAVGDLLADRYRIREKIGSGGMGTVFIADQLAPIKRRVAVKVIKPGMDSTQVLGRFMQERQALALMDHPNIARMLDGGLTPQRRPYFVMELVSGLPLTDFCDQEKLDVPQRIELFIAICQAIQHAHQKGIIHRDLKPSNILVTLLDGKPVPKIIDFGVAKALRPGLTEESVYTQLDALIGTIEYMAPEQAALTSFDIDTRADIYSLGVVLYELLCGQLPFSRKEQLSGSLDEIIRMIREVPPKKPSTRITAVKDSAAVAAKRCLDLPHLQRMLKGDLDWVVMKCLEKERDRRYAAASGLAADLNRYLKHEPVLAAPPSTRYRVSKFVRRNPGLVGLAAVCVLLLMAAVAGTSWGWLRAVRAEQAAKEEAEIHRTLAAFIREDLFDATDPEDRARMGLPPDANVSLRTLLDRAVVKLGEGRFADQPKLERALRLTLAKGYRSLGLLSVAKTHIERADELQVQLQGKDSIERAETLLELGKLHFAANAPQLAEPMLQMALQIRVRHFSDRDRMALEVRAYLAGALRQKGQWQEALNELKTLAEAQTEVFGPHSEEILGNQRIQADLLMELKRFEQAEALLLQALEHSRKHLGETHVKTVAIQNTLGALYRRTGRPSLAEQQYRELLPLAEKIHGKTHPLYAVYRNNLASALTSLERFHDAHDILIEIKPIFDSIGEKHPLTLIISSNLASNHLKLGKLTESQQLYEQLLPRFREVFGDQRVNTWVLMSDMAEAYRREAKFEQAAEILAQLLRFKQAAKPANHENVVDTAWQLAKIYYEAGQAKKAREMLRELSLWLPAGSSAQRELLKDIEELPPDP